MALRDRVAIGVAAASPGLRDFLREAGVSLALAGGEPARLYVLGLDSDGAVVLRGRRFAGAAAVVATSDGLVLAGHDRLWELEVVAPPGELRVLVPRTRHLLNGLDCGDLAGTSDGRLLASGRGRAGVLVLDQRRRASVLAPLLSSTWAVTAAPDGRVFVLAAGLDGLAVFEACAERQVALLPQGARTLRFHSEALWLVDAAGQALLRLDPESGVCREIARFQAEEAIALALRGDRAALIVRSGGHTGMCVVSTLDGAVVGRFPLDASCGTPHSLAFLPGSDCPRILSEAELERASAPDPERRGAAPRVAYQAIARVPPEQALALTELSFPPLAARWNARPPVGELVAVVARLGTDPVGAILAEVDARGYAEVLSWRVLPQHRGQGVGAALARALEQALRAQHACGLGLEYRSDWRARARVEHILQRQGWQPPRPGRFFVKVPAQPLRASRLLRALGRALPPGIEFFSWSELDAQDRAHIRTHAHEPGWHGPTYDPLQPDRRRLHAASVGIREGGEVAGWCLVRELRAGLAEYAALFVRHDLDRQHHLGARLLAEAIRRGLEAGLPEALFVVAPDNQKMQRLARRRLVPHASRVAQAFVVVKRLPSIGAASPTN